MPSTSLTIERVLTLLAETPTRIAALTADLSPEESPGRFYYFSHKERKT